MPELAGLPQTSVNQLSTVSVRSTLWAKHWLLPTPSCFTHHRLERQSMPRGEKISGPIWTREWRTRFLLAPVPSLTWAQGEARIRRLPPPPDKYQTLPRGTLHISLPKVWGLPH